MTEASDAMRRTGNGTDASGRMTTWKVGDKVRCYCPDCVIAHHTIRAFFIQTILLQPYAKNEETPACVLEEMSWIPTKEMVNLTRRLR